MAQQLQAFIHHCGAARTIWALQDPDSGDWVVSDSLEFENTDVMPLWSTEAGALAYCQNEWETYQAVAISIDDYLEHWVNDLGNDGVLVGLDWLPGDEDSIEVEAVAVGQALADAES